jgi:site-specific DNA-methyltransferase (adenine-specific)
MSGCNGMLPAMFDILPVPTKERILQCELPISLCEQILDYVTYEGEVVLDSFAGSGVIGEVVLNKRRNCILIEILKDNISKIKNRLGSRIYFETVLE